MHSIPPEPHEIPNGVIPFISQLLGFTPLDSSKAHISGESSSTFEDLRRILPPYLPHTATCKGVRPYVSGQSSLISGCYRSSLTISTFPFQTDFRRAVLFILVSAFISAPYFIKYLIISLFDTAAAKYNAVLSLLSRWSTLAPFSTSSLIISIFSIQIAEIRGDSLSELLQFISMNFYLSKNLSIEILFCSTAN